MDEKIIKVSNEIFNKISRLPKDSEFTFSNYFVYYIKEYKFEMKDLFDLMDKVILLCKENNIVIENLQSDMEIGMPWVSKYKKNN